MLSYICWSLAAAETRDSLCFRRVLHTHESSRVLELVIGRGLWLKVDIRILLLLHGCRVLVPLTQSVLKD